MLHKSLSCCWFQVSNTRCVTSTEKARAPLLNNQETSVGADELGSGVKCLFWRISDCRINWPQPSAVHRFHGKDQPRVVTPENGNTTVQLGHSSRTRSFELPVWLSQPTGFMSRWTLETSALSWCGIIINDDVTFRLAYIIFLYHFWMVDQNLGAGNRDKGWTRMCVVG